MATNKKEDTSPILPIKSVTSAPDSNIHPEDTSSIQVHPISEVTMTTADTDISENQLQKFYHDRYLFGFKDILRDNLPSDTPHELDMDVHILNIEAEMLISENIQDDSRIVADKTGVQEVMTSDNSENSRRLNNTRSHETNFQAFELVKKIFATPPYEVDRVHANTLADAMRLMDRNVTIKGIRDDLRKLFQLHSPLEKWELI
jgi:hypothetical protein